MAYKLDAPARPLDTDILLDSALLGTQLFDVWSTAPTRRASRRSCLVLLLSFGVAEFVLKRAPLLSQKETETQGKGNPRRDSPTRQQEQKQQTTGRESTLDELW